MIVKNSNTFKLGYKILLGSLFLLPLSIEAQNLQLSPQGSANEKAKANISNTEINQPLQSANNSLTISPAQAAKLGALFKNDRLDETSTAAITDTIPNNPQQIQSLKSLYQANNAAMEPNPISQNQLRDTVRSINLARNNTPPLLHLVLNYATNISFVGSNGKPWPIAGVVPGNKEAIEVDQSMKKDPFNSTVTVKQPWVSTNITYYLQGRVKPIVIFIHTASDTSQGLDSSVNLLLEGIAPGTSPLPVRNVGVVSDDLLNAVNNAPGSQWQPVELDTQNLPVGVQMWTSPDNQTAIVRVSGGQLISPEWTSEASNPDNTVTAYAFKYQPLMLLVNSSDGQSFQIRIKQAVRTLAGQANPSNQNSATVQNISDIQAQALARIDHGQ